MVYFRLHG
ncbi:hypothetical protein F383_28883 [Gossypium arboreum]|uniref:Uncharacterized protein n=1 Tax=Gossypium arboreum TaxID=29729 RepID=A0A0B0N0A4_GOSAR|nr:hypothetical protein F383_29447 [Gossypium arboreum]KHG22756.1 hypothetical protein F383_28883 [Gossypium arboreum]